MGAVIGGQELAERDRRPSLKQLEVSSYRAPHVELLVAHDRVAHDLGDAAAVPDGQRAGEGAVEDRADVAPVGALIRVRADLVRLHDIGPQRDELLLAAARAEGDRAVALALPVLRAEGLEGGLVPDREH